MFYGNGKVLELERDLYRRMEAEVPLPHDKVYIEGLTGIHSSEKPEFSGYFAFSVRTFLESGNVMELIQSKHGGNIENGVLTDKTGRKNFFVPVDKLGDYVVRELCETKHMFGDGAAVLLPSLTDEEFYHNVMKINLKGIDWKFGNLVDGKLDIPVSSERLD